MKRIARLAGLTIAAFALATHPASSDEQALSPDPAGKTYMVALFVDGAEIPMLDCWTFLPDGTFETDRFGPGTWQLDAIGPRAALFQAGAYVFNLIAIQTTGVTLGLGLRLVAEGTITYGVFFEPSTFRGAGFVNPFCGTF